MTKKKSLVKLIKFYYPFNLIKILLFFFNYIKSILLIIDNEINEKT